LIDQLRRIGNVRDMPARPPIAIELVRAANDAMCHFRTNALVGLIATKTELLASDGPDRANSVLARIETYCVAIGSMPHRYR